LLIQALDISYRGLIHYTTRKMSEEKNCDTSYADGIIADKLESGMLQAYPIAFASGSLIGLLWLGWDNSTTKPLSRGLPPAVRIRAGFAALASGLLGARLAFVLSHGEYYANQPGQILMLWEGGLGWAGGAIGALLALALMAAIIHRSFWLLIDAMAIPAAILAFACWFGCLLDGCGYGKAADFGLITPPAADIFGTVAKRWPVQGSAALLCVGIFLLLRALDHRKLAQGALGTLGLAMISGTSLLMAFLRGDPVPVCHEVRLDALSSGVILVLSMLIFALRVRLDAK
jgi:prolipoprotein diacylglyceryltransferase